MAERSLHADLKTALINNDPFIFFNLIKFEKPQVSLSEGEVAKKATDYVYLTDAPYNIDWDDGSYDSLGNANGIQTYIAGKISSVGAVQETIEARASTMSLKLYTSALGTFVSSISQVNATSKYIDTTKDLVEAGFREGDKVYLETSFGSNNQKFIRFDRFSTSATSSLPNSRAYYTDIDTISTDGGSNSYTLTLQSEELNALIKSKTSTLYSNYLNREVFIYRAHAVPSTAQTVGAPFLLFKGIIANGNIQESPQKESSIVWSLSSHWGDFTRVQGRITSDSTHRALSISGRSDTGALIRPEYATDYGFMHSEQSLNMLAQYQATEIRYHTVKKSGWKGWFGATKLVEEEVPVTRDVDIRFDLSAKYLPVVYGVQKVGAIPVFADTAANDAAQLFVVYAMCEGEIGSVFDIHIDDRSSVCTDEMDAEVRDLQTNLNPLSETYQTDLEESNVDVACYGRMDRGDVLSGHDYKDTRRTGFTYLNPDSNRRILARDGIYFSDGVWNTINNQWYDNAAASPAGLTHEQLITFERPIDVDFIVHTGKPDQEADNLLVNQALDGFKIQQDYYSGDPANYWSTSHRLLDTAYITASYTLSEGEETVPETEYVVRGKFIECYNYDSSFKILTGAANAANYLPGDVVSLSVNGDGGSHSNVEIIDKWTMYDRQGNADVRFRWKTNWPFDEDTLVDTGTTGSVVTMTGSKGTVTMHNYRYVNVADTSVQPIFPVSISSYNYADSAGDGVLTITLNTGDPNYAAMDAILDASASSGLMSIGITAAPQYTFAVDSYNGSGVITLVPYSGAGKIVDTYATGSGVFLANAVKVSSVGGATESDTKIVLKRQVGDTITELKKNIALISGTTIFTKIPFNVDLIPGLTSSWTAYSPSDTCDIGPANDERVTINPAIQLLDYITSRRYGRALKIGEELDLDSFLESARLCDDRSKVTLITTTLPTGLALGDKYRINNTDGTLMFKGTIVATPGADSGKMYATHGSYYQITFDHVIGKIGRKWSSWRNYKQGQFVWKDGVVKIANGGTIASFESAPNTTTSANISKVSGSGPASLSITFEDFGSFNPIVRSWSEGDEAFTAPGYSLYDCDDVKYWKYMGWDAQEQHFVTRHQLNQVVSTSSPLFDNINAMLAQFNGILRYSNGLYELDVKTGAPTTFDSVHSISEDEIIGDIKLDDQGQKNSFNMVSANIPDPQMKFANRAVSFTNSTYLKEDKGVPKQGNYSMPGITNYYNARLNVIQFLEESRYGLNIAFTMIPRGYLLKAGRIIGLTYKRFGWTDKAFRIVSISIQPNGLVDIVAREHNDNAYLIDYVDRNAADAGGLVGEQNITPTIPPPTNLQATTNLRGEIKLSWTNSLGYRPLTHTIEVYSAEAEKDTAGEYIVLGTDSFGDPIYSGNDFSRATLLDRTIGNEYVHDGFGDNPLHVWFYWIRYVVPPFYTRGLPLYSVFEPLDADSFTGGIQGVEGRAGSSAALSAITIILDNPTHAFPATNAGAVTSFVGSGTTIRVFEGATEMTFDPNRGPNDPGTWAFATIDNIDIDGTGTGGIVVPETLSGFLGAVIPDFTAIYDDHAAVTYTITGDRFFGEAIEDIDQTQTFVLAKAGADGSAGVDAKAVQLNSETTIIAYDGAGENPSFPGNSDGTLTLTATAQNITNPVFRFTGDGIDNDETDFFPGNTGDPAFSRTFEWPTSAGHISNYFFVPKTIMVEVADGDVTNPVPLAFDTITIGAVKPGLDGTIGESGRTVVLTAETLAVTYNTEGLVPQPASITITAYPYNTVETPHVTFYINDAEVTVGVVEHSDGRWTCTYYPQTDITAMPDKIEAELTEFIGSVESQILARDQITIYGLKFGSDAITMILSNEGHVIPVDYLGSEDYTGSGTNIMVYEGAIPLDYNQSFPTDPAGTWSIDNVLGTDITENPGPYTESPFPSIYAGKDFAVVGDHSSAGGSVISNTASVTYEISLYKVDGTGPYYFEKSQSFSRSFGGASGATVKLTAGDLAVTYDSDGNFLEADNLNTAGNIVITAEAFNVIGTLYYEFFVNGVSQQNTTSTTYEFTPEALLGDTPTLIEVHMREDGPAELVVAKDQITIIGIQQGSSAINVVMYNGSHTVPADSTGNVLDFTGSGTIIEVYEGATMLTFDDATLPANGTFDLTITPNAMTLDTPAYTQLTNGSIQVNDYTAMSAPLLTKVDFEVTVKRLDGVIDGPHYAQQTITKSKQGAGVEYYYIKPTNGTAIKNGTGTLTIEARRVTDGVDSLVSSGTIKLYVGSTEVTVANGYAAGSDGYTGVFDAGDINGAVVVELKDGPTGDPIDTITLVDITDGIDAVYGYIEPSGPITWTRATDQTTWTPTATTVDLDVTFVIAGTEVARDAYRITRDSDGLLTGAATTHPLGDLNTARVTITPTGTGTRVFTVTFDYSFGGYTTSVTETVSTNLAGADGNPGLDGVAIILSNEAHTVPSDNDGSNPDMTGSGTQVYFYLGGTALDYTTGTPGNGQWTVQSINDVNITVDSTPTDSGTYATYGDASNMTQDTAYIEFSIYGYNSSGQRFPATPATYYLARQTFAKSKKGDFGESKIVRATAGTYYVPYDQDGNRLGGSSITVEATTTGFTNPYFNWTGGNTADSGGVAADDGTTYYNGDDLPAVGGDRRAISIPSTIAGFSNPYNVICKVREGAGSTEEARDSFTIFPIQEAQDGVDGVSSQLTKPSIGINTDSNGQNYAQTGTALDFSDGIHKVYFGATDVTTSASHSITGTGVTTGGTSPNRYYTQTKNGLSCLVYYEGTNEGLYLAYATNGTAWTSDAEEFVLRANYGGTNYDKTVTYYKVKDGAGGTTADNVNLSALDSSRTSTGQEVGIRVDNNGLAYNAVNGTYTSVYTWLNSGTNSQYDVKLSKVSGVLPIGGAALDTWLVCSTDRTWNYTGTGQTSFTGQLSIRDGTSGIILDTAIINIDANTA